MWTGARSMNWRYASDLTDGEWKVLEKRWDGLGRRHYARW